MRTVVACNFFRSLLIGLQQSYITGQSKHSRTSCKHHAPFNSAPFPTTSLCNSARRLYVQTQQPHLLRLLFLFEVCLFQQTSLVLSILAQLILVLLCTALPRHEKTLSPAAAHSCHQRPLRPGTSLLKVLCCVKNTQPLQTRQSQYAQTIPALVQWNEQMSAEVSVLPRDLGCLQLIQSRLHLRGFIRFLNLEL